jgi:hypothetical protein
MIWRDIGIAGGVAGAIVAIVMEIQLRIKLRRLKRETNNVRRDESWYHDADPPPHRDDRNEH